MDALSLKFFWISRRLRLELEKLWLSVTRAASHWNRQHLLQLLLTLTSWQHNLLRLHLLTSQLLTLQCFPQLQLFKYSLEQMWIQYLRKLLGWQVLAEIRVDQVSHNALTNVPDLSDIPTDKGTSAFWPQPHHTPLLMLMKRLNKQENALDTYISQQGLIKFTPKEGLEEVRKVISDSLNILVKNTQRMNSAPGDLKWTKKIKDFSFLQNLNSTSIIHLLNISVLLPESTVAEFKPDRWVPLQGVNRLLKLAV